MATATAPGPKLVGRKDYDVNVSSSEVEEIPGTEPSLVEHVDTVSSHADTLAKAWAERIKRDGTKAWINPLAPRDRDRTQHPTKEACQKEIDEHYAAQAEQACMTNQPEKNYTPQEIIIEPERTLEDYMGPKAAAMMQAAKEVAGSVQHLGALAHQLSGRQVTAGMLMSMIENQALQKIGLLADDELKQLLHKATYGGKRKLAKAAKEACAARGITTLIV